MTQSYDNSDHTSYYTHTSGLTQSYYNSYHTSCYINLSGMTQSYYNSHHTSCYINLSGMTQSYNNSHHISYYTNPSGMTAADQDFSELMKSLIYPPPNLFRLMIFRSIISESLISSKYALLMKLIWNYVSVSFFFLVQQNIISFEIPEK